MEKINLTNIIIIILLIAVLIATCKKNPGPDYIPKADTTVSITRDTMYLQQEIVKIPEYIPGKTVVIQGNAKPGASYDSAKLVELYDLIAKNFYVTNVYNDKITLVDSASGKDVGEVNLRDSISQNEFLGRNVNYQLRFPTITNTVTTTITKQAPPKRQFYLGAELTGNQSLTVNGINGILLYKSKKDQLYMLKAGLISIDGIRVQYGIGTAWPLGKK